jgi:hypothetical protein
MKIPLCAPCTNVVRPVHQSWQGLCAPCTTTTTTGAPRAPVMAFLTPFAVRPVHTLKALPDRRAGFGCSSRSGFNALRALGHSSRQESEANP